LSTPPTNHETIKSYLLGQMPEQDESGVEARLISDREFYDELSIVEDELIDQYLGGTLSDSERQNFEAHFVTSPERWQKIRFAKALKKHVSADADRGAEQEESKSPQTSNIFAFRKPVIPYAIAASLIVVLGLGFVLLKNWQGPAAGGRVLAVELTPGPATRGEGEVKEFSLAPDVGSVRLQLDLPKNEYQTYEAVVRDSSLRSVVTAGNLKPQTINNFAAVMMDVKADLLAPGDYRVNLSGTTGDGRSENVATFSFTVRAN
jgi:hypothetical protein